MRLRFLKEYNVKLKISKYYMFVTKLNKILPFPKWENRTSGTFVAYNISAISYVHHQAL